MNVNCEGFDLFVLKSNDWRKYRPAVLVVVEIILAITIEEALAHPVSAYLSSKGYTLFAKSFNSCIFINTDFFGSIVRV